METIGIQIGMTAKQFADFKNKHRIDAAKYRILLRQQKSKQ